MKQKFIEIYKSYNINNSNVNNKYNIITIIIYNILI